MTKPDKDNKLITLEGRILDEKDFWITIRLRTSGMIFEIKKADIYESRQR